MKYIDRLLNSYTMYRVALYELCGLILAAILLSAFGILSYSPLLILFSVCFILSVAWLTNEAFAAVFKAPSNGESVYITALILVLIITPPSSLLDWSYISLATCAAALAMASKYIFAIRKKHIFNPAALAVVITAYTLDQSASWWVGTASMLPFVLIGGLLVTRKIQRFDLFLSFVVTTIAVTMAPQVLAGAVSMRTLQIALLQSPLFFFASVMLTEPLTTPPTRGLRMVYGSFIGFLYSPWVHISTLFFSPELALVVGNVFSYLVSPQQKLILKLKERIQLSRDVFEFVFTTPEQAQFEPGQYMEWTLAHDKADTRGIRRYFTIASSPSDRDVRLGVKFYKDGSTYKEHLLNLAPGETVVASHVSGDFTLPRNKKTKLVFIAGGIGITPFRSMIAHMLDTGDHRDTVLLFANKTPQDVVYRDTFTTAQSIGVKTVYAYSETTDPTTYTRFDEHAIKDEIPDFSERMFYLSGPRGMVDSFDQTLRAMGVRPRMIHKDFFPGFA